MWTYRTLGASSVFRLSAVALFTFLGLTVPIARADVIAAQFGNNEGFQVPFFLQHTVEPDAALEDPVFAHSTVWNGLETGSTHSGALSFTNLLNISGMATGTTLSIANINGSENTLERGSHLGELPDTFVFSDASTEFTFGGLAPNTPFKLFIYALDPTFPRQEALFTVGGSTFDTGTGTPSSLDPDCCVTGLLTGSTDATGGIHGDWALVADNNPVGEIGWSGFQLDVSTAAPVPDEPNAADLVIMGVGLILCSVGVRRQSSIHARRNKLYS